jgi:crotonobetaine/carnitine-CoA ligase
MSPPRHPATVRLLEQLTGHEHGSIAGLVRGRTAATPDARFLRWGRDWTTYAEALGRCERVAGFLRDVGNGVAEPRVATYLPNCPEAIWCWFGTCLSGNVYVPLNRSHRGEMLRDMIVRSGASVLFTESSALPELGDLKASDVRVVVTVDGEGSHLPGVSQRPFAEVEAATPWAGVDSDPFRVGSVMYTSGSTGRSKAVMLPNNAQARGAALVADSFGLQPSDIWHGWPPHYHIMAQLYVVLGSVAAGGGIALQPRFSRSRFWSQVVDAECTVIGGVATVMRMIWSLPDDESSESNPVRLALVSGAFADLHDEFQRRYDLQVIDCYGMTEAEPMTLPVLDGHESGTHGRESVDFELAILDERDAPVACGTVGEIVSRPRTPGVMFCGYEGDSDQTVAVWRNLWFHTGDLGLIDDSGRLHFLDRRKHGIRRSGENISTWELEELLHSCPGVATAVAVGVPAASGEEEVKVIVVRDSYHALSAPQLHEWCQDHMAKFMVPRYIEFLDTMPTLALGKIDRRSLGGLTSGVWDAQGVTERAGDEAAGPSGGLVVTRPPPA